MLLSHFPTVFPRESKQKKNADKTTFFNTGSVPFSVPVNYDNEPADTVTRN